MKKFTIIISIIVVIVILSLFPLTSALIFYDKNTEDVIAYRPLKQGDTFEIIFVHSIHLEDVTEKYVITEDNQIKQFEMVFSQFGIGMPSEVKEDEQIYYEDGFYHLTNINHVFDSLQIRNGKTVSEHRFVWKQKGKQRKQVYLNDYVNEGAWFTLKNEKLSLLDLLREVKIHE